MDRKVLIGLLQDGMQYPPGKHRLWISRCFEITVRSDKVVELDEYEGFSAEKSLASPKRVRLAEGGKQSEMFHVGRSILDLRDGKVTEQSGEGWAENIPKKA